MIDWYTSYIVSHSTWGGVILLNNTACNVHKGLFDVIF